MRYLVAMETYVTLFWSMHFCKVHSIGPINVCTNFEINQYKIDEFRKRAKIVFYLTSWWLYSSDGMFISNILLPTRSLYDFRFKSCGSNSGFNVFDDLDLEFWQMFYWLSHKVGMKYWNILTKFHTNPSRINGWYGRG